MQAAMIMMLTSKAFQSKYGAVFPDDSRQLERPEKFDGALQVMSVFFATVRS